MVIIAQTAKIHQIAFKLPTTINTIIMREILFRGKRIDNGEWVEGSLLTTKYNTYIIPMYDEFVSYQKPISVNSETIGQFTGLTDKNGVKIFEDSDLVEMKFTITCDSFKECSYIQCNEDGSTTYKKILTLPSILTIRNPVTGYEFYNIEHDIYTPLWAKLEADVRCLEIIGNIHDNPESLK